MERIWSFGYIQFQVRFYPFYRIKSAPLKLTEQDHWAILLVSRGTHLPEPAIVGSAGIEPAIFAM